MKVSAVRFLLITAALIGFVLSTGVSASAASATISAGASVSLTATADGTAPFTYQWYKDGSVMSGATAASYSVSSFQAADAGTYFAIVANSAGSTTSDNAVLTLGVANVAPAFTTQPVSQAVTAGGGVTFTVAASGVPAPSYQWAKNAMYITGATSASYSISSAAAGDAGSYTVVATNAAGAVTSNVATLTVNPAPVAPAITTQPISKTVTVGSSVSFSAAASGIPTPSFQWRKNGAAISGAVSASYSISTVAAGDAGSYTVVATNSAGAATSNTATLTVNPAPVAPVFTTQPASQTVTAGGAVTFSAAASGVPAPTYQWSKNGVSISGANNSAYSITSTVAGDAGSYTVVASNSAGSVISSAASLTVNPAPAAPFITTQPISQTLGAGGSATFTVVATGVPAPTYQWRKDGVNLSGATGTSYTATNLTSASAGVYSVVVANASGSVVSFGAVLTINTSPAFTSQPSSQTVTVGGGVTFSAAASGTPAPTYQWKKGGSSIAGATSASYSIASVVTGSAGSYTVVASNSVGSTTSNAAVLTVNPVSSVPVFTLQPASQLLVAGNPATFTAAASGTPTPTYQWKKNNLAIPGATSATYSIPSVAATDEGSYTVVATNSQGAVTSNAASLSVIVAPSNAIVSITVN